MRIFVAHASDFEFLPKLYTPLRKSPLSIAHQIILPQEEGKETITKEIIASSDLLVCDVSRPSTGAGIEMGWADSAGVPIICTYEKGSLPSGAINYVARETIEYASPDELISKLTIAIEKA